MAKYSIEIQDHEGNIYYPHSESATTFFDDGENLDTKVDNINKDISTKAPKDVVTTSENGLMSKEDKVKLNGIATGANKYVHPDNESTRHVSDTEKNKWNAKAETTVASGTANGLMSSTDKKKLDGIATGANNYVHPNDANTRHVTDTEKNTWNAKANTSVATPSANGLMSSADKTKLDGVATGANKYVHPNDTNTRHVTDAEKTKWNAKAETSVATTLANGLMSKEDKAKLDGIEAKANYYVHPDSATVRHVSDTEKSTWNAKANQSELDALKDQIIGNKPIVINNDTPIGAITFVDSKATSIEGWLLCDGRSLKKSDYLDLFNVIGYTHGGSGDNFSLPNLKVTNLVVDGIDDAETTIDSKVVKSQVGIIKAKKLDENIVSVAQEWTNFKTNGGNVGGDISVLDGNGGKVYASNFRRKIKYNTIEHGYSAGFGIESANGLESIVLSIGNNSGVKTVMPIENGTYNLGDPAFCFKDVWIGPHSKGGSGYSKLPNGLIIQWGQYDSGSSVGEGQTKVTYPIAFPNRLLGFNASSIGYGHYYSDILGYFSDNPGLYMNIRNRVHQAYGSGIYWFAIGY